MITMTSTNNNKKAVIFVHGFTGSIDTWKHPEYDSFYELLANDAYIKSNYDIGCFDYHTRLLDLLAQTGNMFTRLSSYFSKSLPKTRKNNGIDEISNLLMSEIRFRLQAYESIIVVAHSMGGLVTKSCILNDLKGKNTNKIRLLVSLAVPHQGANIAYIGKLISSNHQIKDLSPISDLCSNLNNEWIKLQSKPTIKYFYGTNDSIVSKNSATGIDNLEKDIIACDEDHLTIAKPAGNKSTVFLATLELIKEFDTNSINSDSIEYQDLESDAQYQDEFFVLKLLLADVHDASIKNAKYHFLNAEYVRKYFRGESDQRKLSSLYARIKSLYLDSYGKLASGELKSSNELVNHIHEKIVSEDDGYLKAALPVVHGLHKKGMLHQLANDLSRDVWWSEETSISALESLKASIKNEASN